VSLESSRSHFFGVDRQVPYVAATEHGVLGGPTPPVRHSRAGVEYLKEKTSEFIDPNTACSDVRPVVAARGCEKLQGKWGRRR